MNLPVQYGLIQMHGIEYTIQAMVQPEVKGYGCQQVGIWQSYTLGIWLVMMYWVPKECGEYQVREKRQWKNMKNQELLPDTKT